MALAFLNLIGDSRPDGGFEDGPEQWFTDLSASIGGKLGIMGFLSTVCIQGMAKLAKISSFEITVTRKKWI